MRPLPPKAAACCWTFIIAVVAVPCILFFWYLHDSRSEVVLLPEGKAAYYRGGIFHRDKFELKYDGGRWRLFRSGTAAGGDQGGTLHVPFVCPYNESRTLLLQDDGRVFTIDNKKKSEPTELRIVNGEWSYKPDDEWYSIFELYDLVQ